MAPGLLAIGAARSSLQRPREGVNLSLGRPCISDRVSAAFVPALVFLAGLFCQSYRTTAERRVVSEIRAVLSHGMTRKADELQPRSAASPASPQGRRGQPQGPEGVAR